MRPRLSAGTRVAVLSIPVMLSLCLPRAAAFAPTPALASARRMSPSARVHGRGGAWLQPLPRTATRGVRMMATDVADGEVSTGPVDVQSYEAKSSFIKVMQASALLPWPLVFFFTLVTGPRRSWSLKLSDTRVYTPQIRARLGTTAHFCEVVVLKSRSPPSMAAGRTRIAWRVHPGSNPGENLEPSSHRSHPILVAFVWELTKETIYLPLGCLQGGVRIRGSIIASDKVDSDQ